MSASEPTPPAVPPRFEVNEQLEKAGTLFRAHLLKCLPLSMVAVLASSAAELYYNGFGRAPAEAKPEPATLKLPDDPLFWIIDVAGALVSVWLMNAVILRLAALRAGRLPPIGENLRASGARWLPAAGATFLALMAVFVGLLALIVPGVYLAICMVVLMPVVLFEPVDPVGALLRSYRLIRPLWVKTFACVLISAFMGFVCLLALTSVLGLLFGAVAENHLVQAVLQALVLALLAAFYVFVGALSLTIYTTAASSSA